jgi:hypothetical protein
MSQLTHTGRMLQRPFAHVRRNIVAYLALFVALGGTSAYAANEWNSSNIQNETLLSEDVKNGTLKAEDYGIGSVSGARIQDNNVTTLDLADGAVFGNDIRDGSLNDEDVGQGTVVNFEADIGTVLAQRCKTGLIGGGIDTQGDHLLLTPNNVDASSGLSYTVEFHPGDAFATLKTCNPHTFNIFDGTTHFNLLVIDAQ